MNTASRHADAQARPSRFRPDINGLRALAIVLVVAFHACPGALPGGFVGVDVFFVISGYLISGIVLRGLHDRRFGFLSFYGRRVRRIFPALLAVLAATCAFGWISLYASEFETLGKHAVSALGFVLNLVLWNESGYFDVSASQKPLMHLWSLAIEEQFYLLFPVAMWAASRLRLNLRAVMLGALLLSFAWNVIQSSTDLVGDFFDPASRAWEILVGSLLAAQELANARAAGPAGWTRHSDAASITGLLLILGSAFALHDTLRFPGWYALLPTLGTALLIAAGSAGVANQWLSTRAAAWLGVISYPLYLWHWPILSFIAILQPAGAPGVVTAVGVVAALVLAWLTHVAIERPVSRLRSRRGRVGLIALPTALVAFFGFTAYSASGFPERAISVGASAHEARAGNANLAPGLTQKGCDVDIALQPLYAFCQHDSRGPATYALLGDSKAASLAPALFLADMQDGYWLFVGGYMRGGSTPVPVLSDAPEFQGHQASLRPALAAIAADKTLRVVLLAAATRSLFRFPEADSIAALADSKEYPAALDGLDRTVATLLGAGKKVVLLVDNPTFRAPPLCVSRTTSVAWIDGALNLEAGVSSCEISRAGQLKASARYRQLLAEVVARHPGGVFLFDSLDDLCDPVTAVCSAMEGGHHLYSYSDHISAFAARKIARRLLPFVKGIAIDAR